MNRDELERALRSSVDPHERTYRAAPLPLRIEPRVFGDRSMSWQNPEIPEHLLTKLPLRFKRLRAQPLPNGLTIRERLNARVVRADLRVNRSVQRHHVLSVVNSPRAEAADVTRRLLYDMVPVLT